MKITRKKITILAIICAVVGIFWVLSRPANVVSILRSVDKYKAGLTEKSLMVDDHVISYLEGGDGQTVVLLHGFGANKFNWTYFSKYLKGKYHVIAIDIPGFGDSSKFMDKKYDITTQVDRLKKFIDKKNIKQFHVAGNSMGGYIAGMYAVRYPEQILSLGLIAAAGVKSPQESVYSQELKKGNNPLLPTNAEEFDKLLKFVYVNPPSIPDSFKKYLAELSVKDSAMNAKIFSQVDDLTLLQNDLPKIKAKTLIVWGDTDRVLDPSGARVFHQGIANSTLHIIKACGHSPMLEKPEETAGIYLDFLKG